MGNVKLKSAKDFYPYMGKINCKKGKIAAFNFADRIIKNAKVSVYPDDSPILEECDGLLGMEYFLDSIVVLDFEQDLMWIAYAGSS